MVVIVLQLNFTFTNVLHYHQLKYLNTKASPKHIFCSAPEEQFLSQRLNRLRYYRGKNVTTEIDRIKLRRWRKRGFYSETVLVKLLQKKGYNAVRVPVSNPSLNPLPDVMARKGKHIYAFEVKNASYYAYFPRVQIDKLFRFLDQFIPSRQRKQTCRRRCPSWANGGCLKKSAGLTGKKTSSQTKLES